MYLRIPGHGSSASPMATRRVSGKGRVTGAGREGGKAPDPVPRSVDAGGATADVLFGNARDATQPSGTGPTRGNPTGRPGSATRRNPGAVGVPASRGRAVTPPRTTWERGPDALIKSG